MKTNENKSGMKKKDLTYVSLDSKKFLTDELFQVMSMEERGLYCTIIFNLYANGGSISAEPGVLSRLCDCNSLRQFNKLWKNMHRKFFKKGKKLYHKKVSRELARVAKLTQARSEAGVKGNKVRWNTDHKAIAKDEICDREVKGSEAKRSEEKTREFIPTRSVGKSSTFNREINKVVQNSKPISAGISCSSHSTGIASPELEIKKLNLQDSLCRKLEANSLSNQATFRNFVNWLGSGVEEGKFDSKKIWKRIENMAVDSTKGQVRNPAAVFIAKVKDELGYLNNG